MSTNSLSRQWSSGIAWAWLRPLLCLLVGALTFGSDSSEAQSAASKEYQIKAAFLFNFAQFVEWPSSAFKSQDEPFTIGILGDDPFGKSLDQTVQGESIEKHKLNILRSQKCEDLENCQLVFISKSEKRRLPEILSKLGNKKILTVGELQDFATRGGVINFYLDANKVRFEINLASAQREGLKISSQLLGLGKIVETEPPAEK